MAVTGVLSLLTPGGIASIGLIALLSYLISLAVYRLKYHPLAKYPGPKIAALTQLYEFYHDVVRPGQYEWVVKQMHQQYGPIVRISPFELHINDPDFYDELYTGNANPRDKWNHKANMVDLPENYFSTVSSDLHRLRRAPFNRFFSKRSVVELAPFITKHVETLCRRIAEYQGQAKPLNLRFALAALPLDVVTEYCFATPYGALEDPDFASSWLNAVDILMATVWVNIYFPWIPLLLKAMPHWMVKAVNPDMIRVFDLQQTVTDQIISIMDDPKDTGRTTIFHEMLNGDERVRVEDRRVEYFIQEGVGHVVPGQVTTAFHLHTTAFHLLSDPSILGRLKDELRTAMPDGALPPLERLEQLEYLNAVVHEGHRTGYGVIHRLTRVSPRQTIIYKDFVIPPGTPCQHEYKHAA